MKSYGLKLIYMKSKNKYEIQLPGRFWCSFDLGKTFPYISTHKGRELSGVGTLSCRSKSFVLLGTEPCGHFMARRGRWAVSGLGSVPSLPRCHHLRLDCPGSLGPAVATPAFPWTFQCPQPQPKR